MPARSALLVLLLLVTAPACATRSTQPVARPDWSDVEHWAEVFEAPERASWQRPETVVRVLGIQPGDQVGEIGAGTGYMTYWLAGAVQERGRVWAVDIEPRMLQYIATRTDMPAYAPVELVLGAPDDPKLPEGKLDLVVAVNTWHHIAQRRKYLARIERSLRLGGRVCVIDWSKRESPVGPPVGERLSREQVVSEFERSGWELLSESVALPYQYFLTFSPARRPS
jgi:ubiquinone/menaquinone biosynthesis C-methylase UbiE